MTGVLTPEHAQLLTDHAIDLDVADINGVRSIVEVDDLPPGAPSYWGQMLPALLYPWTFQGVATYQLAPDDREAFAKYYFLPDAAPRPNETLECFDEGPVLIVEGSKQQLAAASYVPDGTSVYGIAGCWNWTQANLGFIRGRSVVVIYDGDLATNSDVHDAGVKLSAVLTLHGATEVRFAVLPTTGSDGLDDLLARVDADQRASVLQTLLAGAVAIGKVKKPRARKKRAELVNPFLDPAQGGLLADKMADAILGGFPCALTREHKVAVYDSGRYLLTGVGLVAAASDLLGEQYRRSYMPTIEDKVTARLTRSGTYLPDVTPQPLLNVANGMLDVTTGELHEHDPRYLSTVQLPVEWDPDALCPTYDAWIESVIPEQWEDLEETAATMLDPSKTPTKAVFLYGPSRSGKSTFIRLMQAMVGHDNYSAVTLHQLSTDRFAAANVYGKVLNAAADLSSSHVDDLSTFKMMTGEDAILGDRKFGGQFTFRNQALFAFSANELPTVGESSRAYLERIKPFRFGSSYAGREDASIERRMLGELPGILVRWVDAYQQLQNRGQIRPTATSVAQEFEIRSDRVKQFITEQMFVTKALIEADDSELPASEGSRLPDELVLTKTQVAQAFNAWASSTGGSKMAMNKINDRLTSTFGVFSVRSKSGARGWNICTPEAVESYAGQKGASRAIPTYLPYSTSLTPTRSSNSGNNEGVGEVPYTNGREYKGLYRASRSELPASPDLPEAAKTNGHAKRRHVIVASGGGTA